MEAIALLSLPERDGVDDEDTNERKTKNDYDSLDRNDMDLPPLSSIIDNVPPSSSSMQFLNDTEMSLLSSVIDNGLPSVQPTSHTQLFPFSSLIDNGPPPSPSVQIHSDTELPLLSSIIDNSPPPSPLVQSMNDTDTSMASASTIKNKTESDPTIMSEEVAGDWDAFTEDKSARLKHDLEPARDPTQSVQ